MANLIALDDLEVYEIDGLVFMGWVQSHHQVAINLASHTAEVFSESIRLHHKFIFGSAEDVIGRCVYFLSKVYGEREADGISLSKLSTKSQLAIMAGVSRRATILAMQQLEKDGIVVTQGRKLKIIDEAKLEKMVGWGPGSVEAGKYGVKRG